MKQLIDVLWIVVGIGYAILALYIILLKKK